MRQQAAAALKLLSLADALLVAASLAVTVQGVPAVNLPLTFLFLLVTPFWMFLLGKAGVYESNRTEGLAGVLRKILSVQVAGSFALLNAFLLAGGVAGLELAARFTLYSGFLLVPEKLLLYVLLPLVRRRGFDHRKVCFVGSWGGARAQQEEFAAHPEWGLEVGCVGIGAADARRYYRYHDGSQLADSFEDLLLQEVIDEVLVVAAPEDVGGERFMLTLCAKYGLTGRVRLTGSPDDRGQIQQYPGDLLTVSGAADRRATRAWKRAMDVVLGGGLLLFVMPLLVVIAILVKLSSKGPMLFLQERVGQNGRRFRVFKFRTMIHNAEHELHTVFHTTISEGPAFKNPNDWRVTHVGRYLRRLSLDELPQLVNVLRGEMSLVGPRPLPVHEAAAVTGEDRRRFSVPPGITCLWQVSGRSDVKFADWMRYDLQYIDNWSLWLDAKLLLRTLPAVISGRGAY
jgi:exopolysaccharide biosynthesis polyprenyl glycosylphosphotransferase